MALVAPIHDADRVYIWTMLHCIIKKPLHKAPGKGIVRSSETDVDFSGCP